MNIKSITNSKAFLVVPISIFTLAMLTFYFLHGVSNYSEIEDFQEYKHADQIIEDFGGDYGDISVKNTIYYQKENYFFINSFAISYDDKRVPSSPRYYTLLKIGDFKIINKKTHFNTQNNEKRLRFKILP